MLYLTLLPKTGTSAIVAILLLWLFLRRECQAQALFSSLWLLCSCSQVLGDGGDIWEKGLQGGFSVTMVGWWLYMAPPSEQV